MSGRIVFVPWVAPDGQVQCFPDEALADFERVEFDEGWAHIVRAREGGNMSAGVTLTEPQAAVLRVLVDAGPLGRDFWQLHAALGRSPMQSIRVLRRKGLVDYRGGSYFVARPRPILSVVPASVRSVGDPDA